MTTHTVDTLMALHDKAAKAYSQAVYLVAHVSVNQADQIYQTARETKEALRTALTEALPPQAVPTWLPIESAPMDGTTIVVGYGRQSGFPVKVVFFNTVHKFWSHYGESDLGLQTNATHWMPLPAPPKD